MTDNKHVAEEPRTEDPIATIPADPERSVYRFIIVAAKRARQLQSGAKPKVTVASRKMTRVAVDEVRRGLVPYFEGPAAPEQPPAEEQAPDQ